jgi:hypothetical protein
MTSLEESRFVGFDRERYVGLQGHRQKSRLCRREEVGGVERFESGVGFILAEGIDYLACCGLPATIFDSMWY